jgi:hypothetical protein
VPAQINRNWLITLNGHWIAFSLTLSLSVSLKEVQTMGRGNWEFWLNMTNLALGAITFAAVAVVVGAIAWELVARRARRARETNGLDTELNALLDVRSDSRLVPGLGLTMADGGERIESSETPDSNEKPSRK